MPYTPSTPTLTLCDALVVYLTDQWKPNAPNTVSRAHRGQAVDASTTKGRHVRIIALGYDAIAADRGNDFYTHRVGVLTFERYEAAADAEETIPSEWIDERVDFVHTRLFKGFDFFRNGVQPSFNRMLRTLTSPVEEIYNPDELLRKVFWSEIEFTFEEIETF